MSTYGRTVSSLGHHRNRPVTSASGLSELVSMAYTGTAAKIASRVSTTRLVHTNDLGGAVGLLGDLRIAPSPPPRMRRERQVQARHHEQEEQQQYGHGRAGAEVPGDE